MQSQFCLVQALKLYAGAKMENEYLNFNHSVGNNFWHLEWCPKYRYKIFRKDYIKNLCIIVLNEAAKRYNIQFKALNVQDDHLHAVASLPKGMNEIKAANLLKGFSSYLLIKLVPNLRLRYPKGSLWSQGYFAATVGFSDLSKTIDYVNSQTMHHSFFSR